jgi:hypothetical protein
LRRGGIGEWDLILAINALRNDVAHHRSSKERDKKLKRLHAIYLTQVVAMRDHENQKTLPATVLIMNACALALGVLSKLREDSDALRGFVYRLDRMLNPDMDPFTRHCLPIEPI